SFANEVGDDENFENEIDLSDQNFGEGGSNYGNYSNGGNYANGGNYSNGGGNNFANEDYDMGTADEAPTGELGDYGVSDGGNLADAEAVAGESNFFEAEGNGGNALFANEAYANNS